MEKEYRCSECGKVFGSEEVLEKHTEMEHSHPPSLETTREMELSLPLSRDLILGFLAGIILTSALIGGYSALNSMEPAVDITVVTCENCSYTEFRETTDDLFKVNYREISYDSEKGQEMIEKYDLSYIPGFIFDRNVEKAKNFTRIESVLREFEDGFVLYNSGIEAAQRESQGKNLE